MRLTFNYLILRGLVLVLVGCAVPYYGAPPAPVYYLVQPAQIYYSAQPPSISYLPPQAPSADVPRERHTVAEQKQARANRRHGTGKAEVWINPKPLNGS
jgi:hypothetical protein